MSHECKICDQRRLASSVSMQLSSEFEMLVPSTFSNATLQNEHKKPWKHTMASLKELQLQHILQNANIKQHSIIVGCVSRNNELKEAKTL